MKKIGMITGHGNFPKIFLERAREKGIIVYPLALFENISPEIKKDENYRFFNIGEIGKFIGFFLKEDIKEYFESEVLPFAPDAWIDDSKTKVGYEIPFTRYFYKYTPPKPSMEIMTEIMDIEMELEGALEEIFND